MANDKGKTQEPQPHVQKDANQDISPGNPNKQKQDSPGQQQGGTGKNRDHSRLHEDRSVTDRTSRKSVIPPPFEDDDGGIDQLRG